MLTFYVEVKLLWIWKKKKRHIVFGKFHTKIRHLKKKKCSNKTVTDIKAHLAIRLSASKRPLHTNYLQFLQFYHIYIICVLKWRVVKMRKHDFFFFVLFFCVFFFLEWNLFICRLWLLAFGTNPVVFVLIPKPYTTQCFKYTF